MAGLTTADGCVFPELGLRSEAAIATSSSAMYRKAINIVKQELEATSLDHPALNITKLMEDLELDPVMETASVRLSPCLVMGLVCEHESDNTIVSFQAVTCDGNPWTPAPGTSAQHKDRLRSKRKEIWTWFIEVTVFRILCRWRVALHGLRLPSKCDIDKMGPTAQGQRYAAEFLADQFADSTVNDGSGCTGFGVYTRNISTNTGSGTDFIPHRHEVWPLLYCVSVAYPMLVVVAALRACIPACLMQAEHKLWVPRARYHKGKALLQPSFDSPELATDAANVVMSPGLHEDGYGDQRCIYPEPVQGTNSNTTSQHGSSKDNAHRAMPHRPDAHIPVPVFAPASASNVNVARPLQNRGLADHGGHSSLVVAVHDEEAMRQHAPPAPVPLQPVAHPPVRAADPSCTASVLVGQRMADDSLSTFKHSGNGAVADLRPTLDDNLNPFPDRVRSLAKQAARLDDAAFMKQLCRVAVKWVHVSITYNEITYLPLGLGNSGAALPHAWRALKKELPTLASRLEQCEEFQQGMPVFKASVPCGRRKVADFLHLHKRGSFFVSSALHPSIKVVRAAFIEVAVLHVLRMANEAPPPEWGWEMHQAGDPGTHVPWDWATVLAKALPDPDSSLTSFSTSVVLWAELLSGENPAGKCWSWYSWLEAQFRPQQSLLKKKLAGNVSISMRSTDRHRQPPPKRKQPTEHPSTPQPANPGVLDLTSPASATPRPLEACARDNSHPALPGFHWDAVRCVSPALLQDRVLRVCPYPYPCCSV